MGAFLKVMTFNGMKKTDLPDNLIELDRNSIFEKSARKAFSSLKSFSPDIHKGIRGHTGIIAGSAGMMGAATLAVLSALKSGCGKVTAIIPSVYEQTILQVAPEALFHPVEKKMFQMDQFQSIGIGPGIGNSPQMNGWISHILNTGKPAVFDADALNLIANDKSILHHLPKGSILTPHLKEWERLFGISKTDKERIKTSVEICISLNINILIKGYYSVFITENGIIHINGSGNAGMAKAGSGDVLTGLLSGLLAQGYSPENAGILAMFLHGLSGDLAKNSIGEDSMKAGNLIDFLPSAFISVRNRLIFT